MAFHPPTSAEVRALLNLTTTEVTALKALVPGAAVATSCTVTLSSSTAIVGGTVNVTATPVGGGWPSGETLSPALGGVAGTFSPQSATPTAGSTGAVTFAFAPTSAGAGTVTVTANPSMGTPAGVQLTVSAAAQPVAPGQVTQLAAGTPTQTSVAVTYAAPAAGTAPITYTGLTQVGNAAAVVNGGAFSATGGTFTGLTAGTAYTLLIKATNSAGSSTTVLSGTVTTAAAAATGNLRTVGAGKQFSTIAAAVSAAVDGDTILVDAGTYTNDFASAAKKITIQGVGGMAHLVATIPPPNGKAILTTQTDITVDYLEFSGAAIGGTDHNAAGIRHESGNLIVTNSYFHDNENGILAGPNLASTVTIRNSEFAHNGEGRGDTHNIYIGDIASLTIDSSYFHDAVVGHEIKSRAENTTIRNSRIQDGPMGTASYSINLPNGGNTLIQNNVIEQGPLTQNPYIITFGEEGSVHTNSTMSITGNTIINDLSSGSPCAIWNSTTYHVSATNNSFYGLSASQISQGAVTVSGSVFLTSEPALDTSSAFYGAAPAPARSATIPLGLMPHAAEADPIHVSWPGFAKGDVLAGNKLVATLDGQTIPVQMDRVRRWKDGSVRASRVAIRLGAVHVSGIERHITLSPVSGNPDTTPWITPAQMVAQHDIRFASTGIESDTTAYVTKLRDIVTNAPRDDWGNEASWGWDTPISGPVEVMIRAWAYRRDANGAYSKWARDTVYFSMRIDGSFGVIVRSEQPNFDGPVVGGTLGGNTQNRSVYVAELFDGATKLRTWGGINDNRVVDLPVSGFDFANNKITSLPPNIGKFAAIRVAATAGGSLPSGLNPNTTYFIGQVNYYDPSQGLTLHMDEGAAEESRDLIAFGNAGSGNIRVIPYVTTFYGTGTHFTEVDGQEIVGGKVRADTGVAWDELYMSRQAMLWPRYDQSFARYPSPYGAAPVYPNQRIYGSWLSMTGDDPSDIRIGYVSPTGLKSLLKPYDAGFKAQAIAQAVSWGDYACWMRDRHSGRVLVVNNGPDAAGGKYPRMGASRHDVNIQLQQGGWLKQDGQGNNGYNANHSAYHDGYSSSFIDGSHLPCPWPVAAHITGHPIFADMGVFQCNAVQMYGGDATTVVSGTTYYGVPGMGQQNRGTGWLIRSYTYGEIFTASDDPEGVYISDQLDTLDRYLAAEAALPETPLIKLGLRNYVGVDGPNRLLQTYQLNLMAIGLGMEAWRGQRPGITSWLRWMANYNVGIVNDANPNGGSGWLSPDGYHVTVTDGAGNPLYQDLRSLIAGCEGYSNLVPPFPATDFHGEAIFHNNGGFKYSCVSYSTVTAAMLAALAQSGVVSHNGDDAMAVYRLQMTRMYAAPNTGLSFSGAQYQEWFPQFAMIPASLDHNAEAANISSPTPTPAQTPAAYTFNFPLQFFSGNSIGWDIGFNVYNSAGTRITPTTLPTPQWKVGLALSKSNNVAPAIGANHYEDCGWNSYQGGFWQSTNAPFGNYSLTGDPGTYYAWALTSDGVAYCAVDHPFVVNP